MSRQILDLVSAISGVCPIDGAETPLDWNNKAGYVVWYRPEATTEQRAAAAAVIAAWDPDAVFLPVPATVSKWRFLRALRETSYGNGTLYDAVSGAISAANSPALTNAWNEVGEFVRDSAVLAQLADGLGLTSGQVDDLFRLADSFAP